MENGVEHAESELKPVISSGIDDLAARAQQIAFDKLIDDKLAALTEAGEDLKNSVREKVDNLMIQVSEKRPDKDDPCFDEKIKIYNNWLDQVTEGVINVRSFFNRIWTKVKELLEKVFKWIRDGLTNIRERILNAFRIVKITLFRTK